MLKAVGRLMATWGHAAWAGELHESWPPTDGLQRNSNGFQPYSDGASNLLAMASNLRAMASNLLAMASNLIRCY